MNRIPLGFLPGIVRNIGIAWRLMSNPSVSPWVKTLLPILTLIYYFSPLDLLPGLPFDDLVLLLLVFPQLMIRLSPREAVAEATYGAIPNTREEEEDVDTIDVPWRPVS